MARSDLLARRENQQYFKQSLDEVFVISRIIEVEVEVRDRDRGYQPSASAGNPYLDLDYSGFHKNLIQ